MGIESILRVRPSLPNSTYPICIRIPNSKQCVLSRIELDNGVTLPKEQSAMQSALDTTRSFDISELTGHEMQSAQEARDQSAQAKIYPFDYVFDLNVSQYSLYAYCKPLVLSTFLKGGNSCLIFNGETYSDTIDSMIGLGAKHNAGFDASMHDQRGLLVRSAEDLFSILKEKNRESSVGLVKNIFRVSACILAFCNDQIYDMVEEFKDCRSLLTIMDNERLGTFVMPQKRTKKSRSVYITLESMKDVYMLIQVFSAVRVKLSNAHFVFSFCIDSKEEVDDKTPALWMQKHKFVDFYSFARLHFVQLAPQNVAGAAEYRHCPLFADPQTKIADPVPLSVLFNKKKENSNLIRPSKKSDFDVKMQHYHQNAHDALIACLIAIGKNSKMHVPHRNSRLTHYLRDSLSIRGHTLLLSTVVSTEDHYFQSIVTLRFAKQIYLATYFKENAFLKSIHEETTLRMPKIDPDRIVAKENSNLVVPELQIASIEECNIQNVSLLESNFSKNYQKQGLTLRSDSSSPKEKTKAEDALTLKDLNANSSCFQEAVQKSQVLCSACSAPLSESHLPKKSSEQTLKGLDDRWEVLNRSARLLKEMEIIVSVLGDFESNQLSITSRKQREIERLAMLDSLLQQARHIVKISTELSQIPYLSVGSVADWEKLFTENIYLRKELMHAKAACSTASLQGSEMVEDKEQENDFATTKLELALWKREFFRFATQAISSHDFFAQSLNLNRSADTILHNSTENKPALNRSLASKCDLGESALHNHFSYQNLASTEEPSVIKSANLSLKMAPVEQPKKEQKDVNLHQLMESNMDYKPTVQEITKKSSKSVSLIDISALSDDQILNLSSPQVQIASAQEELPNRMNNTNDAKYSAAAQSIELNAKSNSLLDSNIVSLKFNAKKKLNAFQRRSNLKLRAKMKKRSMRKRQTDSLNSFLSLEMIRVNAEEQNESFHGKCVENKLDSFKELNDGDFVYHVQSPHFEPLLTNSFFAKPFSAHLSSALTQLTKIQSNNENLPLHLSADAGS